MIRSLGGCVLFLSFFFLHACGESPGSSYLEKLPIYPGSERVQEKQTFLARVGGVGLIHYQSNDDYTQILKFYKERLPSYEQELLGENPEEGRLAVFSRTENNVDISVSVIEMFDENKEKTVMISFSAIQDD